MQAERLVAKSWQPRCPAAKRIPLRRKMRSNRPVVRLTYEPPAIMSLLRLYTRVLELLGKEARLGWILAGANLLLAGVQFAEPVMFGRLVDVLSGKPSTGPLAASSAWPLLAAWAA